MKYAKVDLDTEIWWGNKYFGKTIKEVMDTDMGYIDWAMGNGMLLLSDAARAYYRGRKEGNETVRTSS